MIINETDVDRTFRERFGDFLNTTLIGHLILLLGWLLAILLIPIFLISLIFGLTWENVVVKYWYKWTGRKQKHSQSLHNDPYRKLPIKVHFEHIFSDDGQIETIKEKFKLLDEDFDDLEIGQFKTDPIISELENKYFDFKSFVFDNKIFVQEVKLPNFKTDVGFIDCKNLKYQIIKELEGYPTMKFTDKGNTLEILLRQPKMKKLISVELR